MSDVVVAPPQAVVIPLAIEQEPENVPRDVEVLSDARLQAPAESELNVSMDALMLPGGPCTKGGDT